MDDTPGSPFGPRTAPGRVAGLTALLSLLCTFVLAAPVQAGTIIAASCPCGYAVKGLPLFGGNSNFKTVCNFPALCKATGRLTLVNALDPTAPPKDCPSGEVVSYESPIMRKADGGEPIATWRVPGKDMVLSLFAGRYLCPRCLKYSLRFQVVGYWD
ncbi:hypothetical protein [Solidesulfovibrio magneticus]|uniref:hypothetical protein n=1 Tax=Solidesulfovibrio magneticus TaxID=184917 RepID=UPI0005B86FAA|nr:hypothetical protein [Solidesulfovibrio magneticus]